MKTFVISIFTVAMLGLAGCNQQSTTVKDLLNDPEKRTEIYSTISANHQMMMEFMNAVHNNEHAMMMIQEDEILMAAGMSMDNMRETTAMFMQDSLACDHLTDNMIANREVMKMMLNKMYGQGMMDKNSMQETMKKVEKKTKPQYDFSKIRHWH